MYGSSALFFSGFDNGVMNIHSPHSLSSKFRKQRRMDIDYLTFPIFTEFRFQNRQESRQYNKVCIFRNYFSQFTAEILPSRNKNMIDMMIFSSFKPVTFSVCHY